MNGAWGHIDRLLWRGALRHIRPLWLLAVLLLAAGGWASCQGVIDGDGEVCAYTVQLRYDYNEENTTAENRIDYYVRTLEQYLFDEQGLLLAVQPVLRDACDGTWRSELDLPPGRYSVIAVGNRDERSALWDAATGDDPVVGQTRREDLRMALTGAEPLPNGTSGMSERLYHGYRTFAVKPVGASHVRVDVVHAHFSLRFRVTWKRNAPAEKSGYYTQLEAVPSEYALMPEFLYPKGSFQWQVHDPQAHDEHEPTSNAVIHHIPHTGHREYNALTHRHDTYINADNELWGQFVNYRVRNETAFWLHIYRHDEATGQSVRLLTNGIDLKDYFGFMQTDLDHTLRQEYELSIVIDGDTATVSPLGINVADWDEGGTL